MMDECYKREGRKAFQQFGITGYKSHHYLQGSPQEAGFLVGFYDEKLRAGEQALKDARAYHELTVSETEKDRAWAAKLLAVKGDN